MSEKVVLSKASYLLKNTGILALGSFSSKILVFLLVPLYTAVLTTGEYATYDLILNSVNLLIPILTLNISDAVLRFSLDKDADYSRIIHIGLIFTFASSAATILPHAFFNIPWGAIDGIVWLPPLYFAFSLFQLLQLFARGTERFTEIAVAGVFSTLTTVILNIFFLVVWDLGLQGFFLANIIGLLVPCIYLLFCLREYIFHKALAPDPSHVLLKSMVRYALPLGINTISWWLVNVSDVYIVAGICGLDATGAYSIAYKIPAILNVIQTIFLQAWQVSAVKDFDPDDKDGFLRRTYSTMQTALILACSLLIAGSPLIAHLLFSNDFYGGWIYVPFLLIYIVFNSLSGILGGIYMAKKDTVSITISVMLGAAVNIAGGFVLVILIGPLGAALSSLLAGLVTWLYRVLHIRKYMNVSFDPQRSILLFIALTLQAAAIICNMPMAAILVVECSFIVGFVIALRGDLLFCLCKLKGAITQRAKR